MPLPPLPHPLAPPPPPPCHASLLPSRHASRSLLGPPPFHLPPISLPPRLPPRPGPELKASTGGCSLLKGRVLEYSSLSGPKRSPPRSPSADAAPMTPSRPGSVFAPVSAPLSSAIPSDHAESGPYDCCRQEASLPQHPRAHRGARHGSLFPRARKVFAMYAEEQRAVAPLHSCRHPTTATRRGGVRFQWKRMPLGDGVFHHPSTKSSLTTVQIWCIAYRSDGTV